MKPWPVELYVEMNFDGEKKEARTVITSVDPDGRVCDWEIDIMFSELRERVEKALREMGRLDED